ncbi:hypothetical protein Pla175_38200 [Pirellulimonas nuda]|uniref:Four-carbon acid sugar kinase family protein n=1 Tax=Pirellulimonas nuda TaxID=2528009 RepID=A0A518DG12_9BACT|nr:four-carbon acid sugar kinase family protein [Pirellulimonas nuda]QDU90416.1 hypothetical protein Pla175_38200 [Pirellulimonas nuda]
MSVPSQQSELKIAYYGDDFTGSTDAMECLATAGMRTRLFLDPPTTHQLAAMPGLDAIGVAGRSRALPTSELDAEVRPVLTALRELNPRHVHYKVCSTFDSSPEIGSIGRVIDIAAGVFDSPFVPLVVGAPLLGRWCVFGNLFAEVGIGSGGEVHRLDRHPAMRQHPTTPADESDLRRHLARQTDKAIGLFDMRKLDLPRPEAAKALGDLLRTGPSIVLFDALTERHIETIGRLIDAYADNSSPCFSVGSSSIETALAAQWGPTSNRIGTVSRAENALCGPVVVASGSRSPVAAQQIDFALTHGFVEAPMNAPRLMCKQSAEGEINRVIDVAVAGLQAGRSVIVHTTRGPHAEGDGVSPREGGVASTLGGALGTVLAGCVSRICVRRACLAGGDSSSYAARAMGITSLEMIESQSRGAPLCRVWASRAGVDGLEMAFKGGQVGRPDYFVTFAQGAPAEED